MIRTLIFTVVFTAYVLYLRYVVGDCKDCGEKKENVG